MGVRFGEHLRAERLERGLSEAELGKDLYSPSYILLLETGRREPTPEVIQELAHRLELAPKVLEPGSQPVAVDDEAYVRAALHALEAWDMRDYVRAASQAAIAAQSALEGKDESAWWEMTYMQAECLMKQGELVECQGILRDLLGHRIVVESDGLAVRAHRMLSVVSHGLGQPGIAIEHAREAVRIGARLPHGSTIYIAALRALIGPLAETDRLDEAWDYCKILETLVDGDTAPQAELQLAGEVEWVIGNVAFMRADPEEGVKHHERAARLLSPSNDFAVWARFNKATAAVRLSGGIVEPETLAAIERAELALSIARGSRREQLEVAFIRAQWFYLDGQIPAAIELLKEVRAEKDVVGSHTAGEAAFLHGRALKDLGRNQEALELFKEAREQFIHALLADRIQAVSDAILDVAPNDE